MPDFTRYALLSKVDHIVYATPNLEISIKHLEHLLGVRATPGGQHPQWCTRNALISLGDRTYLEIVGPDPVQAQPKPSKLFGIDKLKEPKLVTWAAYASDLERLVEGARLQSVDLGRVLSGNRQQPDGIVLSWAMTDPFMPRVDSLVPFFIDWGMSAHPAKTAITGCTLINLRAEHPDASRAQTMLARLELNLSVTTGAEPALIATLMTPRGRVELR